MDAQKKPKLYDAGCGRREKQLTIRMRGETYDKLLVLCKMLDRKKTELIEILITKKYRELSSGSDN